MYTMNGQCKENNIDNNCVSSSTANMVIDKQSNIPLAVMQHLNTTHKCSTIYGTFLDKTILDKINVYKTIIYKKKSIKDNSIKDIYLHDNLYTILEI